MSRQNGFIKWFLNNRGGDFFGDQNDKSPTHQRNKIEKKSKTKIWAFDPFKEKYVLKDKLIKKYGPEIPTRENIDNLQSKKKFSPKKIEFIIQPKPKKDKRLWRPQAIAIVLLLWALFPKNSYDFYILLRLVCCAIFTYLAIKANAQDNKEWVWILGVTAVIYNPMIRFHLTREIWSVINILTIIMAIYSTFILKANSNK